MFLGNGILPFPFRWTPVIPISYENYVSQTEILELFADRLNKLITEYNTLISELPDSITMAVETAMKKPLADIEYDIKRLREADVELRELIERYNSTWQDSVLKITKELSEIDVNISKLDDEKASKVQLEYEISYVNQTISDLKSELKNDVSSLELKMKNSLLKLELDFDNKLKAHMGYFRIALKAQMKEVQKMLDDLPDSITVTNPVTGVPDTLNNVLYQLYWEFNQCPTCEEYYYYNLTCQEYRDLNITCKEYRDGKISHIIHDVEEARPVFYNQAGQLTNQPTNAFNQGLITAANMSNYHLTVDNINKVLENNVLNADLYGKLVYGNVFNQWVCLQIAVRMDELNVIFNHDFVNEKNGIGILLYPCELKIEPDYTDVPISVNIDMDLIDCSFMRTYTLYQVSSAASNVHVQISDFTKTENGLYAIVEIIASMDYWNTLTDGTAVAIVNASGTVPLRKEDYIDNIG